MALASADLSVRILWLGGVLVAMIIVGALLIAYVRRQVRASGASESFTLGDLREMRRKGEITEREFENMRTAIVGDLRGHGDDRRGAGKSRSKGPDAAAD